MAVPALRPTDCPPAALGMRCAYRMLGTDPKHPGVEKEYAAKTWSEAAQVCAATGRARGPVPAWGGCRRRGDTGRGTGFEGLSGAYQSFRRGCLASITDPLRWPLPQSVVGGLAPCTARLEP